MQETIFDSGDDFRVVQVIDVQDSAQFRQVRELIKNGTYQEFHECYGDGGSYWHSHPVRVGGPIFSLGPFQRTTASRMGEDAASRHVN